MLIVGLNNTGRQYASTRHNAGAMLLDRLVALHRFGAWERSDGAQLSRGPLGTAAKPATFINLSGAVVARLARGAVDRLLVAHDDLDLPLGKLKLKHGGSAGGHRGVLSCEHALRSKQFWRLRVGIGRPESRWEVPDYVLQPFTPHELSILSPLLDAAARHFPLLLDAAEGISPASCSAFLNAVDPPPPAPRPKQPKPAKPRRADEARHGGGGENVSPDSSAGAAERVRSLPAASTNGADLPEPEAGAPSPQAAPPGPKRARTR
ncbi:hypothetical protein AB1Y20_014397 [Prymnesium parvum]|uniref:Peptidyl-tRNA hydrolase n=1 Tax=Prymnesium parvum TaxID=97485 RepID=A0AB34IDW8_PRYPA